MEDYLQVCYAVFVRLMNSQLFQFCSEPMTVLSKSDILYQLGKNIFIHPFMWKENGDELNGQIKGCDVKLTASEYAYYASEKGVENVRADLREFENHKEIVLPNRKTTVVWTEESVFLKEKYCGTIHSKVKHASSGLGHIGTRVDPNYVGVLAIAMHNTTDRDIIIEVGETIAYLRIHELKKPMKPEKNENIVDKFNDALPCKGGGLPRELNTWLVSSGNGWRYQKEPLIKECNDNLRQKKGCLDRVVDLNPKLTLIEIITTVIALAALIVSFLKG